MADNCRVDDCQKRLLLADIEQLRAQVETTRSALQFVIDGYARNDVSHQDYRVEVYQVALDAMSALSSTESQRD
jgi:hypothetical protein